MMTILTTCPICGKVNEVNVKFEDYLRWQDGELVQNAFPYLNANDRELLLSGICSKCWDKMYGENDDDDDESENPTDWEEYDYDFEFGFDPYAGCYTGEC